MMRSCKPDSELCFLNKCSAPDPPHTDPGPGLPVSCLPVGRGDSVILSSFSFSSKNIMVFYQVNWGSGSTRGGEQLGPCRGTATPESGDLTHCPRLENSGTPISLPWSPAGGSSGHKIPSQAQF